MDDGELLKRYVAAGSEEAFRLLVERNLPLVYSAALRKTNNPSMAEDVTQVVFIILAKKAHELATGTILAGWLHRTTYHVTMKALVKECRRRQREEKAVQMQTLEQDSDWESLAPVLDDALAELGDAERSAIVLRYFQNRSFREVGKALGITDDTAQKKVSRSMDKLRRILFKRGVAISLVSFAGLTATRAAQFAPETLAARVIPAALKDTGVSASAYVLLEESIKPVLTLKLTGAWAAAAVALLAMIVWATESFAPPSAPSSRRIVQEVPAPRAPQPAVSPAPATEPQFVPVMVQQPPASKVISSTPTPVKKAAIPVTAAAKPVLTTTPAAPAYTPTPAATVLNTGVAAPELVVFDTNSLSAANVPYDGTQSILPQNRVFPIIIQNRSSTSGVSHEISRPPPNGPRNSGKIQRRQ